MTNIVYHFAMTYEQYREHIGYKNASDFNVCPEKFCRTGNFHAASTPFPEKVTCPECNNRMKQGYFGYAC